MLKFSDLNIKWRFSFLPPNNKLEDNCTLIFGNGKFCVTQNVSNHDSLRDDMIAVCNIFNVKNFDMHINGDNFSPTLDILKKLPKDFRYNEIVNKLKQIK